MDLVFYLFVLLFGLTIGSFISCLTWRYPKDKDFIFARSICPICLRTISWYDNIPLVSYILLKGRCRNCKEKISLRYPIIETACGLGFLGIFYFKDSFPYHFAFYLFIFAILLAIFVIDLEHQIIPDSLVFILVLISFSFLIMKNPSEVYLNLAISFGISSFLLFVHLVTKGRGMGLGDVKFALFPPLLLGWPDSFYWIFGAFLLGALVGIILILLERASFAKKIAFGPFLVISFFLVIIFG